MKKKRNGELDFWKFIFSVIVVLCHSTNMAGKEKTLFPNGYGVVVVDFFFLVSGILMAGSASRNSDTQLSLGQDTFQFMKKKLCGLMPNIYIAWGIAFIVEHIGEASVSVLVKDAAGSIWELLFITEAGLLGYRANTVCWYISAMLLAMFLTYPLMRKYKDTWFYIIAPLAVIFLMGLTYQDWKNFSKPHAWLGIVFKSQLRAFMGIMLGSILYKIGTFLHDIPFTYLTRGFLTFVEWSCYAVVAVCTFIVGVTKGDWVQVFLLAIAATITFAQVDSLDGLFSSTGIFSWLGEFSFSLFLGHGFWSRRLSDFFPNLTYMQKLPIYLCASIITGLMIMYISLALRKWWDKNKKTVAAKFIVMKNE